MGTFVTTFSVDLSTEALNENLIALKAGDAASIAVLVEGFESADSGISVTLYAKLDATDTDGAATTITKTATLTTPTRDANARLATFALTASDTTNLLNGRVYRVEVIATRAAVQYTRTVMWGMIGAAYPGNTVVAPSDEAALRLAGDATVLSLAGSVPGGGTGLTSYAIGDLLYATGITTLARKAIGAANAVLASTGTAPAWVTSLALAGTIAASGGFTGDLTGNVTGNVTGNLTGNVTGNATTATTAAAAPASGITGTTLAANVVTSSLTTVGVLAAPHMTAAVIDSGGLTVTLGTSAFQAVTATTIHATSTAALDGTVTLGGNLVYTTAASRVVPGATSYSIRNNANNADNWIITDAGAGTLRTALVVGTTGTFGALVIPAGVAASSSIYTNRNFVAATADTNDGTARGGAILSISYGKAPVITTIAHGGAPNAPTAVGTGINTMLLDAMGYDGTGYGVGARIAATPTETWSLTARGSKLAFSVTANTTTTLAVALTLDQDKSAQFAGAVTIAGSVGFYGTSATAKQAPTGSRGGNAALASLLTALATIGLITDSTSA